MIHSRLRATVPWAARDCCRGTNATRTSGLPMWLWVHSWCPKHVSCHGCHAQLSRSIWSWYNNLLDRWPCLVCPCFFGNDFSPIHCFSYLSLWHALVSVSWLAGSARLCVLVQALHTSIMLPARSCPHSIEVACHYCFLMPAELAPPSQVYHPLYLPWYALNTTMTTDSREDGMSWASIVESSWVSQLFCSLSHGWVLDETFFKCRMNLPPQWFSHESASSYFDHSSNPTKILIIMCNYWPQSLSLELGIVKELNCNVSSSFELVVTMLCRITIIACHTSLVSYLSHGPIKGQWTDYLSHGPIKVLPHQSWT